MIGLWGLLGTTGGLRPGRGSWCLQSGHQLHCQRHQSGPCTWLPDKLKMEEIRWEGYWLVLSGDAEQLWGFLFLLFSLHNYYCFQLTLGKNTTIVYSPVHIPIPVSLHSKSNCAPFQLALRHCEIGEETFEKVTWIFFKVCITVTKSFTRLRKWDKFPVMAPGRLKPFRLRQFHVIWGLLWLPNSPTWTLDGIAHYHA